jgi:hypothetical protein
MSLEWIIRDHKCVEIIECFQLHCSYALFGIWVMEIYILEVLRKTNKHETCTLARRYSAHGDLLYPLPRPLGAIHSCSYSRKRKEEWGEEKKRREGGRWEKLGFHPWITDHCCFRSSSKIIGVRSFFSLLFLWEIDARVWQFSWIS